MKIERLKTFPQRKVNQIKRKLKLLNLQLEGNAQKRWYGSEYGGFYVREAVINP